MDTKSCPTIGNIKFNCREVENSKPFCYRIYKPVIYGHKWNSFNGAHNTSTAMLYLSAIMIKYKQSAKMVCDFNRGKLE